jgi:hypothetical protein
MDIFFPSEGPSTPLESHPIVDGQKKRLGKSIQRIQHIGDPESFHEEDAREEEEHTGSRNKHERSWDYPLKNRTHEDAAKNIGKGPDC